MNVGYAQIAAATATLGRIAFSRGQDSDPTATLALWRRSEGILDDALEQAANESADDTISEIEQIIAEGGSLSTAELREYVVREYLTSFQIGWITRARAAKRDQEDEATVREAARDEG